MLERYMTLQSPGMKLAEKGHRYRDQDKLRTDGRCL